mmetsp:Transcript_6450/g.11628  ORF Transcript_6450/g.11628 Transcript_6450/m.11628 type:complete len:351 (-) Transcript_6450:561-1613(-)
MSSEAATANTYSSAFAQLPLYRELSPDAGKSSHVNRKREWHQKFQEDLMRRGSPDEPDDAEAEAVEALKGAKVPRVAGSFMNDSGRFTKGSRVAEAREVLRPAAVHAHRPLELGGNGAFISPVSARGVLQTSASSIARPDGAYKAGNMDELLAHLQHAGGAAVPEDDKVSENADFEISQENIGAKKARHARRGPMDEMRQLVRILVKIVPQSLPHLATTEDGGGNRISEEQIKYYLDKTLGHAPRPDWGLPRGWGQYLAGGLLPLTLCILTLSVNWPRRGVSVIVSPVRQCIYSALSLKSENADITELIDIKCKALTPRQSKHGLILCTYQSLGFLALHIYNRHDVTCSP